MASENMPPHGLEEVLGSDSRLFFYLQSFVLGIAVYTVTLSIYRLTFHPLARFPGPKLTAVTLWYEFYYDVVLRGKFLWQIEKMHEKYGPIVRVNPHEIHINDPWYYDVVFSGGSTRRNKYEWSARMFSNPGSIFGTVFHEHHRLRRGALASFFSKASITRIEPMIKSKLEELSSRFEQFRGTKEPIKLEHAFTAMTTDLIGQYAFGKSFGYVQDKSFAPLWSETAVSATEFGLLCKQFPMIQKLAGLIPLWFLKLTKSNVLHLVDFRASIETEIEAILTGENKANERVDHATMFHEILNSISLPADEKTQRRLLDEAHAIVAAGAFTTADVLKAAMFYLLDNPTVLRTLREELDKAASTCGWEDPFQPLPPAREFESLPYMNMVYLELLRITYGATGRLTRIAMNEDLIYTDKETGKQWEIKRGTPISMNAYLQHRNPTLFPDPDRFDPERFRESVEGDGHLDKYLVNFSKGSRACMGSNLARAELFLGIPVLVRRFLNTKKQAHNSQLMHMELFETDRTDVKVAHDFFTPFAKMDSKGTRVLIS